MGAFLWSHALAGHFDYELASHDRLEKGYHYFVTADGQSLRINGSHLARLSRASRSADGLLGEMEYEGPWGQTFIATWTDVEYPLGTRMKRRGRPHDRRPKTDVVVGYDRGWHDPRRSKKTSLSSRVKARAYYIRLVLDVSESGVLTVKRKVQRETVDETRPEKKAELATWRAA